MNTDRPKLKNGIKHIHEQTHPKSQINNKVNRMHCLFPLWDKTGKRGDLFDLIIEN